MRRIIWISLLSLFLSGAKAQVTQAGYIIEVVNLKDGLAQYVVSDPFLYYQRWDTLAQTRFWRRVMTLPPDSAVLNVAANRQVLEVFSSEEYEVMTSEEKSAFKQQKLTQYGLPPQTRLYVTYGKSDYYQIRSVMPSIDQSIDVFKDVGADPWYAQAILLIESPGALRKSYTGAYGPFQLMRSVAIEQGLRVNSQLDEREDLLKSARAAAKQIQKVCIPQTRRMLDRQGLDYQEEDLWFRLMVLHSYHAGAGNVAGALRKINPSEGGMAVIQELWKTRYRGFGNASQNYSQVALASLLELDAIVLKECKVICSLPK